MAKHPRFPITAAARRQLDPDGAIFDSEGQWAVAGIRGARVLAIELNRREDAGTTARAGAIHALDLLHRVLRELLRSYRDEKTDSGDTLLQWLRTSLGEQTLDSALLAVAEVYPPPEVFAGTLSAIDYLGGDSDGVSHRLLLLEELLLIWWIHRNPALESLRPIFDDSRLEETAYAEIGSQLIEFQANLAPVREDGISLLEILEEPLIAAPDSLRRQLEVLAENPELRESTAIPERAQAVLRRDLLVATDLLREEEKASFSGPGPVQPPAFVGLEGTPRRFAEERPWMGEVVIGAKHVHVWLHQLAAEYGESISRLHEIPLQALAQLVEHGYTALWLIGIWERSPASRRIKRLCGNPQAEASAYSLFEYRIADDLGGESSLEALEDLCKEVGLRLATDMVPNHTGIDSRWVTDHPDYFLGLEQSPFPNYSFDGPDLSPDEKIAIHLEDHYYDQTDAAVVFRRTDRLTGERRFIYHGNDGTGLPWSDTAQLNYLNPEVREAVIDQIIAVAQRFPVVRFDAAMTLTMQHFHRLWYPAPGTGGDIPSRAEHGVEDEVFTALMPAEFWWEVAQRLREEAPDTLLIAEAFWLLEGYFVRSLGIHRVYNSAFMHMLREEDLSSLRKLLSDALLFDPAILARFVNFLSNPDEESVRQQFGSGSKYFAAASLLATLPGTPMFAHGQIGGLSEKYGMEYRRPYRPEKDDPQLLERHARDILPLLRIRSLLSGSTDFELFELLDDDDSPHESVLAFTNRSGAQSVLVICNYSDQPCRGRVEPIALPKRHGDVILRASLREALGLGHLSDQLVEISDPRDPAALAVDPSDLESRGLEISLAPFQVMVAGLCPLPRTLSKEAPGLAATIRNWVSLSQSTPQPLLNPLQLSFRDLLLLDADSARVRQSSSAFIHLAVQEFGSEHANRPDAHEEVASKLLEYGPIRENEVRLDPAVRLLLRAYDLVVTLSAAVESSASGTSSARSKLDLWNLGPAVASAAKALHLSKVLAQDLVGCLRALVAVQEQESTGLLLAPEWLRDPDIRDLLRIHDFQGVTWFQREGLERLLWARFLLLSWRHEEPSPLMLADLILIEELARLASYQLEEFRRHLVSADLF